MWRWTLLTLAGFVHRTYNSGVEELSLADASGQTGSAQGNLDVVDVSLPKLHLHETRRESCWRGVNRNILQPSLASWNKTRGFGETITRGTAPPVREVSGRGWSNVVRQQGIPKTFTRGGYCDGWVSNAVAAGPDAEI